MKLCILHFLQKLSSEGKVLPQIRSMIREEIERYIGMRLVLAGTEKNKEHASTLVSEIDKYLQDLTATEIKFKFPFMALLKTTPNENPAINPQVMEILKQINAKEKP